MRKPWIAISAGEPLPSRVHNLMALKISDADYEDWLARVKSLRQEVSDGRFMAICVAVDAAGKDGSRVNGSQDDQGRQPRGGLSGGWPWRWLAMCHVPRFSIRRARLWRCCPAPRRRGCARHRSLPPRLRSDP